MVRDRYLQSRQAVMRHPDGSINFNAYRAVARRERKAAIMASIDGISRAVAAVVSLIGTALVGKSAPHSTHQAK